MRPSFGGIHHVTAISSDAQATVDFYAGVLGLRLVKRTVNFDDPGTYHLYFGDEHGRPGTILTFFPWTGLPRGVAGAGQVTRIAFAVPPRTLDEWLERLAGSGVAGRAVVSPAGDRVISLSDPDGLVLDLVGAPEAESLPAWGGGPVPRERAIRGFHGVTLSLAVLEPTATLLAGVLGFEATERAGGRIRLRSRGEGHLGSNVDLFSAPDLPSGRMGVGTVHHVAWRVPDDAAQLEWRRRIVAAGLHATPVIDRLYFRSVYFREPGGVLFEIATDPPGFAVDEPLDSLGAALSLPPWLESTRDRIARVLPPLSVPVAGRVV